MYRIQYNFNSLTLHGQSPCTVTVTHLALSHSRSPFTITVTHLALSQSLTLHCHSHSPCTVTVAQSEESLCPIQLPATQLNLPDSPTLEGVRLSTPVVVFLLKSLFCLCQVNQEVAGLPDSVGALHVNDTCLPTATVIASGFTAG